MHQIIILCLSHARQLTSRLLQQKLNSAQMNYLTIDKELLFVVSTVKGFQSMLLGAEIHIYTDHKNILSIGDSPE